VALKSTIFKANVAIADIDHAYYADHALTLARHPSETDERMMVRLVALALNAYKLQSQCNGDGTLAFGAGLSNPDDPDLVLRDYTGRARMWVEVGQPEDKPLLKACGQADEVLVYAFSSAADVWWRGKFAWEYKRKGKHRDLVDAYRQLLQYREALENPPLLVVCDIARTEIHTNFTGTAAANVANGAILAAARVPTSVGGGSGTQIAFNISVSGVTSEATGRAVGEQIGKGAADALARRGVIVAARTG
jgi:uncharacterized protein YaeQ